MGKRLDSVSEQLGKTLVLQLTGIREEQAKQATRLREGNEKKLEEMREKVLLEKAPFFADMKRSKPNEAVFVMPADAQDKHLDSQLKANKLTAKVRQVEAEFDRYSPAIVAPPNSASAALAGASLASKPGTGPDATEPVSVDAFFARQS